MCILICRAHTDSSEKKETRDSHGYSLSQSSQSYDDDEAFYSPSAHQVKATTVYPSVFGSLENISSVEKGAVKSTSYKKLYVPQGYSAPRRHTVALSGQGFSFAPKADLDLPKNQPVVDSSVVDGRAPQGPVSTSDSSTILRVSAVDPPSDCEPISVHLVQTFGLKQPKSWKAVSAPKGNSVMASQIIGLNKRLALLTYQISRSCLLISLFLWKTTLRN